MPIRFVKKKGAGDGHSLHEPIAMSVPLFTNPITSHDAPDPWMIYRDGWYWFTGTLAPEKGIWIWKSRTLTGIDKGKKVQVWQAPPSGPQAHQIWAPELHFLRGKWYLYYTASDGGSDRGHRHYVLEAKTRDPQGEWIDRGPVDPNFKSFAIDGTVLEMPDGRLYFLFTTRALHIAPMSDPCTVSGPSIQIAAPSLEWEHGWLEGPEALIHDGRIFVVYSAGHSAKVDYRLGLLSLVGNDPLNPASWRKSPNPVFEPYGTVYTTGHNSFTRSPDGREDWLIYHAKTTTAFGFGGRTCRAQPFTWNEDGTPNFGRPVPIGVLMALPSGQKEI